MYRKSSIAVALFLATLTAGQSLASAFSPWRVSGVSWGDTLNVRKYPASYSQKQTSYPNGTELAMTGRCTGGVDLFEIERWPVWRQKQAIRYQWCEVWHDPTRNGEFVTGWVYGKYITPSYSRPPY